MTIAAVSGQNGGAAGAVTTQTSAFGSDVSADSLVVVLAAQLNGDNEGTFADGDCTQSAGTASLGTIALDENNQIDTGEVFLRTGVWSAIVTTGGSCTMQVSAGNTPSKLHVHRHEFTGSWDASRVEDSSSAASATEDLSPDTGSMTSAGAALFIGILGAGDNSNITITDGADYTEIADTAVEGSGPDSYTQSQYRIVSTGTTDEVDWTIDNSFGQGASGVVYKEAAGGIEQAIGQVTETDTAQAIGSAKETAIGQAAETDAAQTMTPARTYDVGQVTETDTAQPLTSAKDKGIGQVAETDTAQPMTPDTGGIEQAIGQVAETDVAQAMTRAKAKAFGQVIEIATARPITSQKAKGVAQVAETDTAQAIATITKTASLNQVAETDTALPMTVSGGGAPLPADGNYILPARRRGRR